MDRKQKAIFLTLWFILIGEWIGMLILIYFARLPYFISLFVVFIQIVSPWLVSLNVVFLIFTLFTRGVGLTWTFWKDYTKESFRFFISSFFITLVVITLSSMLGTALGLSADRISKLSTIKGIREWVADHFY